MKINVLHPATILTLVALLCMHHLAQAQFNYTVTNGAVTITKYTGSGAVVTIPASTNGYPVTSVGNYAFEDIFNLSLVTVPASVTNLGSSVFADCFGLTGVIFLGNAPSLGSSVFQGCAPTIYYTYGTTGWGPVYGTRPTSLWALDFGYTTNSTAAITVTRYTGSSASVSVPPLIIGMPVTTLSNTFYHCAGLTNVAIPAGITSIGTGAFFGCSSLVAILVDSNSPAYSSLDGILFDKTQGALVAYPGGKAGNYTIGAGVTNVGTGAFLGCAGLPAILVDSNNPAYSSLDGVLFDKAQTTLIAYPAGKIGDYTVPTGVTVLGVYGFSSCRGLTNVTLQDGITSIGNSAFYSCTRLASITIPDSVTDLGNAAFYGCAGLTNAVVGNGVTSIGSQAFLDCTRLTSIIVPDSVTNIGESAFFFCTALTNAVIGNGVRSIGAEAFNACSGLRTITLGDHVATIGDSAFVTCSSLTTIIIPDTVTSIGNWAFFMCSGLTNAVIGNGVRSIGDEAFNSCGGLRTLTLGDSLTNIGDSAFDSCGSLSSVTIPASVTSIGDWAFFFCTGLTSVSFLGNAPSLTTAYTVFAPNTTAIVYYLPGTTGWGTNYGGLSTAPWFLPHPLILSFEPAFALQTNGFGFLISWATNASVVVEACTNLAGAVWSPVSTNALAGGSSFFSDPQWSSYPARFYRLRWP
ncbi:MAG TPA: leucine-rich repeat protein [Candidatus Acidoferrum sp.]|nr:leucine-rich repeat protein [Candidatus Acidoferrum sp.]